MALSNRERVGRILEALKNGLGPFILREYKMVYKGRGLWNGSIPFGYCNGHCSSCTDPNGPCYCPHADQADRADGQALIAHPLEALAVQRAFELSATGRYTDRDIADWLNRETVSYEGQEYPLRPKRRPHHVRRFGPPVFGKDIVREMLIRVFYTGVVPYFGTRESGQKRKRRDAVALYPGQHPTLISQELYDQVQAARKLRSRAPQVPAQTARRSVYPLSGLLVCGQCGKRMRAASNKQGRRYYRCATCIEQSGQCDQPTVNADDVEAQVLARFQTFELPGDWQSRLIASLIPDEEIRTRRQAVRQRLQRAQELYIEGDLERTEYDRRRARYRSRLADLTTVQLSATLAAGYLFANFPALWEETGDLYNRKNCCEHCSQQSQYRGMRSAAGNPTAHSTPCLETRFPSVWGMRVTAGATGFEPAISGLTGQHVNRYTTPPIATPCYHKTPVTSNGYGPASSSIPNSASSPNR